MGQVVAGITIALEAIRLLSIVGPEVAKVIKATIETLQRLAEEWKTPEVKDVAATFNEFQALARKYVLTAATLDLGEPPAGKTVGDLRWDSALRSLQQAAIATQRELPDRIAEKIVQDAYVDARNDADKEGVPFDEFAAKGGSQG